MGNKQGLRWPLHTKNLIRVCTTIWFGLFTEPIMNRLYTSGCDGTV